MKKFKYIIYSPPFDENSGGAIVLHRLCDLLNNSGEEAYMYWYDVNFPKINFEKPFRSLYRILRFIFKRYISPYKTNPQFKTPIANSNLIDEDCIVVYPEIINGNPLNINNAVRWLLYRPGFHTGEIKYNKNDIFFFFQKSFDDEKLNKFRDHYLNVVWIRDDIYKQTNFGERQGSCYMLRKGKGRKIVHDLEDSILLDNKTHIETAKIMNNCEYFICYDLHTMYTAYAVLCGCKVVVIPADGITKDQRQPNKVFQSGIAYGFDDLDEALRTRHLLYDALKKQEMEANKTVEFFIKRTYELFGN